MNILHISFLRTRANGIYSVLSVLCNEQKLLGHKVMVIKLLKNNEINDSRFINLHSTTEIQKHIEKFNPNIVIFHSVYAKQYIYIYKFLNKTKIPYLVQLHGALSYENYNKGTIKKYIANLLFFNRFLKGAKGIIYLNNEEYNNSIVKRINSSFSFISNGCYLPSFEKKIINYKPKLSILYIGRIDIHHKGLDVLLEAIHILINKNMDNKFHLTIYGNGLENDVNWLSKALSTISPDFISFKGPIYGRDKEEVLKSSDIFILTSRYEGMPMGVLEALSYGLPCLLTPGTNLTSDIEKFNAGWRSNFSAQDIADTIEYALNDFYKNNKILIENAQLLAKQYSWERIAQHSVSEYKRIIK